MGRKGLVTTKLDGLSSVGDGHSRQHDAHARTLVDDHNPRVITELHHLLCVWIVAGSERIGTKPEKQVEVLHQQWPVKALPSDLGRAEQSDPLTLSKIHFLLEPGALKITPFTPTPAQAQ